MTKLAIRWGILIIVAAEIEAINNPPGATVALRLARAHAIAIDQGAHGVARSIAATAGRLNRDAVVPKWSAPPPKDSTAHR